MEKVLASYKKAVEAVEKQKGTIERHEKQLTKKIDALAKTGVIVDLNNLDAFKWVDGKSTPYYWEVCEIDNKADDVRSAKKKLIEKEKIVAGWKEKVKKAEAKEQILSDLPAVIIEFGERYKKQCIEWYFETLEEATAKFAEVKATDGFAKALVYVNNTYGSEFYDLVKLGKQSQINAIEKINETRKNNLLQMLVIRVKDKVGKITDAGGLRIGSNGEINGLVIGTDGEATVNTIYAGGYNIQCLHYRVLVK